jgi:uncharacterized protein (TIGR02246 family)
MPDMKRKPVFLLFTLLVLLLAMAGCGATNTAPTETATDTAADSAAVEALIKETYRDALAEGDTDAVIGAYAADGIMIPQGFPTAEGQDAVRGVYDAIFAGLAYDLQFTIDEVIVFGDYAIARSTSAGTVLDKATNQSAPDTNRESWVLQKVGGEWKIARYMFNKDGS